MEMKSELYIIPKKVNLFSAALTLMCEFLGEYGLQMLKYRR